MSWVRQKRKSTREPQISANSRADRKRAKQHRAHRMVMSSLESKTRGGVYVKFKIINDAVSVNPWMTEDILNISSIIHNQKISNNQLQ